jgi:D-inositol-3-phosphate glycosyltransferase
MTNRIQKDRDKGIVKNVALISVHGCPMALPGTPSVGGMNVYLRQLAPLLASSGVAVDIFTRKHDTNEPDIVWLGPRTRVIHIPAGPIEASKENLSDYLKGFGESVTKFVEKETLKYDLVHSHYWLSGWVGQRLAETWELPHIVTFHTLAQVKQESGGHDEPLHRHKMELQLAKDANRIVAFSDVERTTLIDKYGVLAEDIDVIPGGVDLIRFRPGFKRTARKRLGLDIRENIILYVGRLEYFKGIQILLKAFSTVVEKRELMRLFIVGGADKGDPDFVLLKEMIEKLGIDRQVTIQFAVPQQKLRDYYIAADILALPSFHETFGLVALEAMACGTPVVAARVGALPSVIEHQVTGYLVDTHDPSDFSQTFIRMLSNKNHLKSMGRTAIDWAGKFPWYRVADEHLAVYNSVVGRTS